MAAWITPFIESCLDLSQVLNRSITAGWMVLIILLLRPLLQKAPRHTHLFLWGLVALRLILPVFPESSFRLFLFGKTILSTDQLQIRLLFLTPVWLGGMAALFGYVLFSYGQLRQRITTAVRLRDNLYQSEFVTAPFILGLFHPKIYLPYREDSFSLLVLHEETHLRRHDPWWKALGFLLLAIHWFNPLMWLAYHLLCRDLELACDEQIMKRLSPKQRDDYSQTIPILCAARNPVLSCPLSFDETSVRWRKLFLQEYQRPAVWVIAASVILCVIAAIGSLADPSYDYVQRIHSGNVHGRDDFDSVTYRMELGHQIKGGTLYVEDHKSGDCLFSTSVPFSADCKELTIFLDYQSQMNYETWDHLYQGLTLRVQTDNGLTLLDTVLPPSGRTYSEMVGRSCRLCDDLAIYPVEKGSEIALVTVLWGYLGEYNEHDALVIRAEFDGES